MPFPHLKEGKEDPDTRGRENAQATLTLRGPPVQQKAAHSWDSRARGPKPYFSKGLEVILCSVPALVVIGNMDQTLLSLESERSGLQSQLCHSLALGLGQIT